MQFRQLSEMIGGWFVGGFIPSVFKTEAVEVAVKTYKAGTKEAMHYHKVATEITVIVSGRVRMAGRELGPGDIVVLQPDEASEFEALTDAVNVVVKLPGALNDKYPGTPATTANAQ